MELAKGLTYQICVEMALFDGILTSGCAGASTPSPQEDRRACTPDFARAPLPIQDACICFGTSPRAIREKKGPEIAKLARRAASTIPSLERGSNRDLLRVLLRSRSGNTAVFDRDPAPVSDPLDRAVAACSLSTR